MRDNIYEIVKDTVYKYKTSNPFEICKKLGIKIDYVNYGKAIILDSKIIKINKKYTEYSRYVLCAHELGHAILHKEDCLNYFDDSNTLEKIEKDRQAYLFAAYLLFEDDGEIKFENMNSDMIYKFIESHLHEVI